MSYVCDGELELLHDEQEIELLSPTSVKIQHIIKENRQEILVIDGMHDTKAFEYTEQDWRPIPTIDIHKPYGHVRKISSRIF